MSTVETWARFALAAVGALTFGAYAEVHVLLALVMVGLWLWYAATYPPQRVAGLYIAGTLASLLLRAYLT